MNLQNAGQWATAHFFPAIFRQISLIHFYFLRNGKISTYYTNIDRQKIGTISLSGARIPSVSATRVATYGTDGRHSSANPKVGQLILTFTRLVLFRFVLCSMFLCHGK
jgi:hypothetical protein